MLRSAGRVLREQYIGVAALFIALGGTSYAAVALPANSVSSKQLRTNAVTAKKIGKGAVTAPKLARNAVASGTVLDGSLLAQDFKAGQLPAGEKGVAGPAGPAGAKGDPGEKGATGDTGPAGPLDVPAGGDLEGTYPAPTLKLPLTRAASSATPLLGLTSTATSGAGPVIDAQSDSTSSGAIAVRGRISPTNPGADSVAVRGLNQGTGGFGIGVMGTHAGSGWGVQGSSASGIGVRGFSNTGTAILALSGSTDSDALEINGPLKVSGSRAPGFVQTVNTASNTCATDDYTVVNTLSTNGRPDALLFVTPRGTVTYTTGTAVRYTGNPSTVPGCPADRWLVYKPGLPAWVDGDQLNVLVVGR